MVDPGFDIEEDLLLKSVQLISLHFYVEKFYLLHLNILQLGKLHHSDPCRMNNGKNLKLPYF